MTQPPPMPWDADPEVDERGNPVAAPAAAPSAGPAPWEADPDVDEGGAPVPEPRRDPGISEAIPGHPTAKYARGLLQGGIDAVNPVKLAKAAIALGKTGFNYLRDPYSPESLEASEAIGRGIPEMGAAAIGHRGPEAAGEVHAALLAGLTPTGKMAAGTLQKLGATEASRAYNVKRALRVPPRSVANPELSVAARIEAMAPEIDLPVSVSPRRLARHMTEQRQAAGRAVETAENALPATDINVRDVINRVEMPPGQWVTRNGGVEFVPDDPAKLSAWRASMRRLEEAGGDAGVITARNAIRLKRSGQAKAAEGRAYTSERAGLQARAAEERAAALRAELEALPGVESEAFTRANRRFEVAKTAEEPIVAEAGRLSDMPLAGRGVEMLLGRAIPGSGFARQALGGLAGGAILDSTLFHTASAATKRRVIDAIQSGQPQLATDILFRAAVAKTAVDRRAAAALRAQGEGVTQP